MYSNDSFRTGFQAGQVQRVQHLSTGKPLHILKKIMWTDPRLGRHTPGVVEYEIHRVLQVCLYLHSGRIAETIVP